MQFIYIYICFYHNHIFYIQTWFLNVISAVRHLKKRKLGRHVRSVHENQRHKCGICMKLFTRKYTLTNHEKRHTRVLITI